MTTKKVFSNGTNSVEVTLRPFRPGEDEAILACLRDEYGETYDARDYYTPRFFTRQSAEGAMQITVAERAGGEVIGFLIIKHQHDFPDQVELGTMVLKKAWRSYHISGDLITHCCALAERMSVSAYFGHAQVFHNRSAAKLYAQGLRPCGYMLSMFISDTLVHSFGRPKALKLPWSVILKAAKKRDAGLLHLPERHCAISRRIYGSLDVGYRISTEVRAPEAERAALRVSMYQEQNTLRIMADAMGRDLLPRVREEIAARDPHLLTVNLWINVSDPTAVWAYEALAEQGFFFTGFQPLAEGAEYMILHHPMSVEVTFDDFAPFQPTQYILDYVKEEYRRARPEKE